MHGAHSSPKTEAGRQRLKDARTKHGLYAAGINGSLLKYLDRPVEDGTRELQLNYLPDRALVGLYRIANQEIDQLSATYPGRRHYCQ